MNDKVVSMRGTPMWDGAPVLTVVEACEAMLEKAKSGEITGIAAGYLYRDDSAGYETAGYCKRYQVLGALDAAKHSILKALMP